MCQSWVIHLHSNPQPASCVSGQQHRTISSCLHWKRFPHQMKFSSFQGVLYNWIWTLNMYLFLWNLFAFNSFNFAQFPYKENQDRISFYTSLPLPNPKGVTHLNHFKRGLFGFQKFCFNPSFPLFPALWMFSTTH